MATDHPRGWVALLRGVNLGARNKVPMTELRVLLERAGYGSVRTYLQSGNVLLAGPATDREALTRVIESLLAGAFGVAGPVIARSFAEIRATAASRPFGDEPPTYVSFLSAAPASDARARLAALDVSPDRLWVEGSEVFVRYASDLARSRLTPGRLERALGITATARNWRTVTTLALLVSSEPGPESDPSADAGLSEGRDR